MGRRQRGEEGTISYVAREIRDEAAHQLRGFPREFKRQLRSFGREAVHQLGSDWGEEFGGRSSAFAAPPPSEMWR